MSTHTPGPWKADGYYVKQGGQSGTRMVADVCYTGPHHTPPEEYPKSCRLADEANARLIAAAPELLEALQNAASYISDHLAWFDSAYGGHPSKESERRRIVADLLLCDKALAKATGKEWP